MGNKHPDKLSQEAVGTAMPQLTSTLTPNDKAEEKAQDAVYEQDMYRAIHTAIEAGKSGSEVIASLSTAILVICTLADTSVQDMERVVLRSRVAARLCSQIKHQPATLHALRKDLCTCTDSLLAAQLLPHIVNLGEVHIQIHEKVQEWRGWTNASIIMHMMSSQEYYEDLLLLETILASCMSDPGAAMDMLGLLLVDPPESVDKDKLQGQLRERIRVDMKRAVWDIFKADLCGAVRVDAGPLCGRASKLCNEYGLDLRQLRRKEWKRWRLGKLNDLVIPWTDICILDEVGKDEIMRVLRCMWQGHIVAVKEYWHESWCHTADMVRVAVERGGYLMSQLRHPNIHHVYGIINERGCVGHSQPMEHQSEEHHYALVLELHERGSLQALMTTAWEAGWKELLPLKRRVELALQIAQGMAYLHGRSMRPIVHGKLTAASVLIAADGRAVISDFGAASRELFVMGPKEVSARVQTFDDVPGTVYCAPEMTQLLLIGTTLPPSIDVFSFAMLMFELMTLQPAFTGFAGDPHEYWEKVGQGKRPAIPPELPPVLQFCIMQCWAQDPASRPNFSMVVDMLNDAAASLD